jgi:hypothetical protein
MAYTLPQGRLWIITEAYPVSDHRPVAGRVLTSYSV